MDRSQKFFHFLPHIRLFFPQVQMDLSDSINDLFA